MTNGWSGGTPVQFSEGTTQLELATKYTANEPLAVSGIRVWAGTVSASTSGRTGKLWSSGGGLLTSVQMTPTLPTTGDYTVFSFVTPYLIAQGTEFYVSYDTIGDYGAVVPGGYPLDSSDAAVTATAGRFGQSRGVFPNTPATAYYGIDIVYTIDSGSNIAPEFGGITLTKNDLDVTATVTVDDETPETVTLNWNWGDGTSTNTGGGVVTAQHTYSASGLYAVLVTATDALGATGTIAGAVQITASGTVTASGEWFDDIFDAVVSDAQRSGYFDKVNRHEPKKAPGTGLTAAIWLESMEPIGLISGLASTSARLVFKLRVYQHMLMEPQDMIDPRMAKALANLMRRYHDDFDFEGAIRNIDLLGAYGVSLSAITGYLDIDGKMFRIADLTIPCLVNDVWPQVS